MPFAIVAAGLLTGCAGRPPIEPQPGVIKGLTPAEADARAEVVRQDPVAYIQRVGEKCRTLQQYTLLFTRQERRGLLGILSEPEHIRCWYRRQPFSVRMKWLDEELKYGESVYGEGQADNKVRFVTRWWVPPLLPPPAVNKVDLETPVTWGESKRPLTDFGLERMMDRTLDSLNRAGSDVTVTYEGLLQLPDNGPTTHNLHLEYPPSKYKTPVQDLYIDITTDLPAGTILKLANGNIDAVYYYYDLNTHAKLTDADFLLEAERPAAEKTAKTPPAKR